MKKITNQKYNLVNTELKQYDQSYWYWDDYDDDDDWDYYEYDHDYSYDELEPIQNRGTSLTIKGISFRFAGPRYTPYQRINMDSVYSKEILRDKKIDRILGLSNDNYKQPTLEDFFKNERILK